ncbi:acetyl-CoA synthetase-like protein [Dendrothele bispora CBS 962.96]|uniref:Acetyl-CoA synthetase-like protein n=1 Tax=Dendrothele bispora (strain CBS 962.96) TaxID=1314807 RepID=A0A4S8LVS7_DENBC|nr:acetyl-CoA synthetase-like protein [Dendrothele bispora CBS 962.96]
MINTLEKTHLQILDDTARLYPNKPLFWLPKTKPEPGKAVEEWVPLTRRKFHWHVLLAKKFYAERFATMGVPAGSVVGLWLSGNYHTDLIHALGVAAAGCVPQLFSLYYSHSEVVFELLISSEAKALVIDSTLVSDISGCPVPIIDVAESKVSSVLDFTSEPGSSNLGDQGELVEPLQSPDFSFGDDKDKVAIVHHTSGSTGKIPKLIPWTHKWLTSVYSKFKEAWAPGPDYATQDVYVRLGNFNHCAVWYEYLGCVLYGGCMIMPSTLSFSTEELLNMIKCCGLNRLCQYSMMMQPALERAQREPEFFQTLKGMRTIMYGGTSLAPEMELWAHESGLNMANIFASSECGLLMISSPGPIPSLFKPLSNISYRFVPARDFEDDDGSNREGLELLELVILPDSPDFPTSQHLLDPNDRLFYTGDFFERTTYQGGGERFIFRGRKNDWIKCAMGQICDAKAIEDAVRQYCADLISDCVVVGQNRRGPALLIETKAGKMMDGGEFQKMIVRRLEEFNRNRFPHERVSDPHLVLVVESGILPRTASKGNIRRKSAEEQFKRRLDEAFICVSPVKHHFLS